MSVSRETLERYFPDIEAISRYAEFLVGPGIERGLIGPREGERIWERHILNCLPITTLIPQGASVIDVGSGAGLPGIVIKLARPDLSVTLIEPLERRCDFLRESGVEVEVVRGRAEDVRIKGDIVTARAVAPLPKLVTMVRHLIAPGGALLAMKGASAEKEMEGVAGAILHEISLEGIEPGRVVELRQRA